MPTPEQVRLYMLSGAANRPSVPAQGGPQHGNTDDAPKAEDTIAETKTGSSRAPLGPAAGQAVGAAYSSGHKRSFADMHNQQGGLVRDTVLENESGRIDIKEDGFFAGPYKQERMLTFEVEKQIEEAEMKEEPTVGDRTASADMCPW
jgi:hypothetical protein